MYWVISTTLWFIAFWYLLPVVMLVLCFIPLGILVHHFFTHSRKHHPDNEFFDYWRPSYNKCAVFWRTVGRIWHGYEIEGLENIPLEGAALLVCYHGAIPMDLWFMGSELILRTGRPVMGVGDNFLYKIPGGKTLLDAMNIIPGPLDRCIEKMSSGHIFLIAPGGIRESQFSDENYNLVWGRRLGYAKLALQAKVPIIPIFTENHRESYRCPWILRKLLRGFYEKCRWPIVPFYGGIPVKLITHVGKPIPYDSSLTPEELAEKTKSSLEELIRHHQTLPGSIFQGLKMRFVPKRRIIEN